MKQIKHLFLITLALLYFENISAQDLKLWSGYTVQAKLTKEWRLSAGQLFMFNSGPMKLSSVQNRLRLAYRFNSRLNVALGYVKSARLSDPDQEARHRLGGRVNIISKLQDIRVTNTLRAEWHFPERSKFQYRFRYAIRIQPRNWDLPLKARPYITNELHYYLSGRPLWYRDASGEKIIRQSPNGLHAHRLALGVRTRPIKRLYATLSYMRQTEFNIGNEYRKINVRNPRDGDINRKFNNFSTLNLSLSYRLDLRR